MSNEEILEEIYGDAHKCGVFNEFIDEVNKMLKTSNSTIYEITEQVYHEFKQKGLIIEVCPV
jgi:hypothetical protein